MRKSIFILGLVALFAGLFVTNGMAQDKIELGKGWGFEESITIPVLKIVDVGGKDGVEAQAELYTGLGGGVCFSYQSTYADGTEHRIFTFSPLTILLSGQEGAEDTTILNIAYAMTTGFFDDKIMIGVGRDFGEVGDRSRWFMMMSLGVTFN